MFGMFEAVLGFMQRNLGNRADAADGAGSMISQLKAASKYRGGMVAFTEPGTYSWTVPPNIYEAWLTACGGGAGGGGGGHQNTGTVQGGAGGGGLNASIVSV